MEKTLRKLVSWFKESNRYKHVIVGFLTGLFLTIFCTIGAASAGEYKDKAAGNAWDWIDWWCTIAGGILGQACQTLIVWIIISLT